MRGWLPCAQALKFKLCRLGRRCIFCVGRYVYMYRGKLPPEQQRASGGNPRKERFQLYENSVGH